MILETTHQMYMSFLDGIKKYGTGAANPAAFNRIINDWGQDLWVKTNVRHGVELTQNMQDRLSILRVLTDGVYGYSERIDMEQKKVLNAIPCNSSITNYQLLGGVNITPFPNSDKYFKYPYTHQLMVNNITYPPYLRLLGIAFKINYVNNICNFEGISEWLDANILKSDNKAVLKKNPFRKPKNDRLYYEIINEHFVLTTGTESTGNSMRLDYLRHPRRIFYNTNNSSVDQEQTGVPDYSGTGTAGSVNCELPNDVRQEIVDIAVRTFIERVKDPRYQTYINELNIKRNG